MENRYKRKFKEFFHPKDALLKAISFEELIETVQANEPEINEKSIMKVYNELLKERLSDASYDLKKNMKQIIKECQ